MSGGLVRRAFPAPASPMACRDAPDSVRHHPTHTLDQVKGMCASIRPARLRATDDKGVVVGNGLCQYPQRKGAPDMPIKLMPGFGMRSGTVRTASLAPELNANVPIAEFIRRNIGVRMLDQAVGIVRVS